MITKNAKLRNRIGMWERMALLNVLKLVHIRHLTLDNMFMNNCCWFEDQTYILWERRKRLKLFSYLHEKANFLKCIIIFLVFIFFSNLKSVLDWNVFWSSFQLWKLAVNRLISYWFQSKLWVSGFEWGAQVQKYALTAF